MATKKGATKSTKKGASKKGGGSKKGAGKRGGAAKTAGASEFSLKAADRTRIDRASQSIAQAIERALEAQRLPGRPGPIIVGIRIDPRTKRITLVNELER